MIGQSNMFDTYQNSRLTLETSQNHHSFKQDL